MGPQIYILYQGHKDRDSGPGWLCKVIELGTFTTPSSKLIDSESINSEMIHTIEILFQPKISNGESVNFRGLGRVPFG